MSLYQNSHGRPSLLIEKANAEKQNKIIMHVPAFIPQIVFLHLSLNRLIHMYDLIELSKTSTLLKVKDTEGFLTISGRIKQAKEQHLFILIGSF